jgi:uncharacterized membrane protein YkvA (DUF1232 family)
MNSKNSSNLPQIPGSQGFFHELALRIKLFLRMMKDPRINIFLKSLPVLSVLYLISPLDLAPLMPLDDAAILSMAFYLFIELSPKAVIDELMNELRNLDPKDAETSEKTVEIIEGIINQQEKTRLDIGEQPDQGHDQ